MFGTTQLPTNYLLDDEVKLGIQRRRKEGELPRQRGDSGMNWAPKATVMKLKADRSKDFFKWEKNHDPKCGSGNWQSRGWRGPCSPRGWVGLRIRG